MFHKLLIAIVLLFAFDSVSAADTANLRVEISGTSPDHFICLYDTGCFHIVPGMTYRIIHRFDVGNIYMLDHRTGKLAPQPLNASCSRTVMRGKTLVVSGKLGSNLRIAGLHCSLR